MEQERVEQRYTEHVLEKTGIGTLAFDAEESTDYSDQIAGLRQSPTVIEFDIDGSRGCYAF